MLDLCRRTRVLVSAGVIAAGAAAVTVALVAASASHRPSALAPLTSALVKTSADSYNFTLDTTVQLQGREMRSDVVSGAFDPEHEVGAELLLTSRTAQRPVRAQIRFVGQYVYTWVSPGSGMGTIGKPWNKAPLPPLRADELPGDEVYGFVTDRPVSPAELSGALGSAGTVRDEGSASGPGWTGTKYTFTASFSEARETINGTEYVDQQGRVRRVVTVTTHGALTTDRDLILGNFGAPVSATAPLASQTKYTSNPFWGFYF
jgi:hypothetical protein